MNRASSLNRRTCDWFVGAELKKTGSGGGVEREDVLVHEIPLADAFGWLRSRRSAGCTVDVRADSGIYAAEKLLSG